MKDGPIFVFGPFVGPARAATGSFPFDHRTVEECDIEYEDLREACEENMRGRKW